MKSLEALEKLKDIAIYEENNNMCSDLGDCCDFKGELVEVYEKEVDAIEKDLEILEQHRKIECELDIDLITFFKALRDGVWVKNSTGQIYYTNVYLQNLILSIGPSKYRFCFATPLNNVLLLFDRINLDWALDKKELEDDK